MIWPYGYPTFHLLRSQTEVDIIHSYRSSRKIDLPLAHGLHYIQSNSSVKSGIVKLSSACFLRFQEFDPDNRDREVSKAMSAYGLPLIQITSFK